MLHGHVVAERVMGMKRREEKRKIGQKEEDTHMEKHFCVYGMKKKKEGNKLN